MSKGTNTRTYSNTIMVDNAIRTLMPNSVYNFFIHYVRKDGSYTNGYQLKMMFVLMLLLILYQ